MTVGLAVFARAIRPGQVKTRLIPALGAEGAAGIYGAFVADTLAHCASATEAALDLWVAGDPQDPGLGQARGQLACHLREQPSGDLGARLTEALEAGISTHGACLLVGTDSPSLPSAYLQQALELLSSVDLVLGPAADGGYYSIGAGQGVAVAPLLQNVRWSSPQTLADTTAAAHRQGLRVALLAPWFDVDSPADLRLLALQLSRQPRLAPATWRYLCGPGFPVILT